MNKIVDPVLRERKINNNIEMYFMDKINIKNFIMRDI